MPTPVQEQSIPKALEGRDLIASAQTGSGKTAAFCLPLIEKLVGRSGTYGLILCPTREIALQTQETMGLFGAPQGISSISLIGGTPLKADERAIGAYPHVIVGTPGRICDHLERGNLWLDFIEWVILDEADRMLDMGFSAQLSRIMQDVPKKRQTLLFSATMPSDVEALARRILHDPLRVSIGQPLAASRQVHQKLIWVSEHSKGRELRRILLEEKGTVIVFTRTREAASRLWIRLHSQGFHDSTYISSDKKQEHREEALEGFKSGKYRILVATDVAGRGIHVENVSLVVNHDLPMEPEDYIHRIGRTGRKEHVGHAVTLATRGDRVTIHRIEKILGKSIPAEETADFGGGHGDQFRDGGRGGRGRDRGYGRGHGGGHSRDHAGHAHAHEPRAEAHGQSHSAEAGHGGGHSGGGSAGGEGGGQRRRRRRRGGRGRRGGGGGGGGGSGGSSGPAS